VICNFKNLPSKFFIVGLGNPGEKFKDTRHNVGFKALDFFALENNFPEFKFDKKSNSLISERIFNNQKVLLIKPQTFMNLSGKSIKFLLNYYNKKNLLSISHLIEKITKKEKVFDNLVVIHDDLDIDIGEIKKVQKKGAAGHNGVKSIIQELGTNNFIRIRIGIKKNITDIDNKKEKIVLSDFVLSKFENGEKILIERSIKETSNQLKKLTS